jgi:hypothetical protein
MLVDNIFNNVMVGKLVLIIVTILLHAEPLRVPADIVLATLLKNKVFYLSLYSSCAIIMRIINIDINIFSRNHSMLCPPSRH